jgi:DNA-binding NarL/FixJ family response regulator
MNITILLADDFPEIRQGIRNLLEAHKGWTVVAEAEDGKEALEKALDVAPDVAVIDIAMPKMNGLELARELHRRLPDTEILMVTQYDTRNVVEASLRAGARGYVLKSSVGAELVTAVEAASQHKRFISPSIIESSGLTYN